MKALRLETYGKPFNVLRLEDVAISNPGTGQVRVRVHACALNPADWAVCEGFLARSSSKRNRVRCLRNRGRTRRRSYERQPR